MIGGQTVLAVIPARGGSKGVPGKNIREVGGKPLIAWSIEAARGSRFVDRLILSSDDDSIIRVAQAHGCEVPFVREGRLAEDETTSIEVVLDVLNRCPGFEWLLLLQPTSPLRTAEDIDRAVECLQQCDASTCVSVCRVTESPYWMFTLCADNQLRSLLPETQITRRQDLPLVYIPNGAMYLARTEWLKQHRKFISHDTVAYEMPVERSVDLDTELDFQQLNILMENR